MESIKELLVIIQETTSIPPYAIIIFLVLLLIWTVLAWFWPRKSNSKIFQEGQRKALKLDGHKATVTLVYCGNYSKDFDIKIRLKGGTFWTHTASTRNNCSKIFPQGTHSRTWRYQIVWQSAGKGKLRISLQRAPRKPRK